ncbi:uncharacterized protein BX663DRAFT_487327 [Cokeromyces recurvatus]|uniref:uncharacterized protein n=1 Tax=Cokeromyces recurvatus TaxID=90255 RepID=UPI00221E6992|nr:uncharacterized protein BX663DRAFT_487327 [Cokeromyces recurvatus]KAI7901603.1 hypothetical protein BX663DRAFT_487327 [Cokeromyces recurvatus]
MLLLNPFSTLAIKSRNLVLKIKQYKKRKEYQTKSTVSSFNSEFEFNASAKNLFEKGTEYLFGRTAPEFAVSHFLQADKLGDMKAKGAIGFCYEFGLGVKKNYKQAERYYRDGAGQNDSFSMLRLRFLNEYGAPNIKMSLLESLFWKNQLKNKYDAIQWIFYGAAVHNHPAAQYVLASCYMDGICVAHDESLAFHWYKASAKQLNPQAQCMVAYCYHDGVGTKRELKKAITWFFKAAEQNDLVAMLNLGHCYESGNGVIKDLNEAINWFKRSGHSGNRLAQFAVGRFYEKGIAVQADIDKALKWYTLSAKLGCPYAATRLGYFYQNGIGVKKDSYHAFDWYLQASLQGYAEAQYILGIFYENGIGIQCSLERASKWYKLAAKHGYDGSTHITVKKSDNRILKEKEATI